MNILCYVTPFLLGSHLLLIFLISSQLQSTTIGFLTLDNKGCPCTFGTCLTVIARRRLARLPPRRGVIIATKESPTSSFLFQLAMAAFTDPRYGPLERRRCLYSISCKRSRWKEKRTGWECPIMVWPISTSPSIKATLKYEMQLYCKKSTRHSLRS